MSAKVRANFHNDRAVRPFLATADAKRLLRGLVNALWMSALLWIVISAGIFLAASLILGAAGPPS